MTTLVTTEIDPNSVRPGWVALLIVLALGAATALLVRNMAKQLKKIDFDGDFARDRAQSDGPPSEDSSADPAGAAESKATDAPTKPEPSAESTESDSKAHSQQ
jgi:hypothetical protein